MANATTIATTTNNATITNNAHLPRIALPYYNELEDGYTYGKTEVKWFYLSRDNPILLVPPGILDYSGTDGGTGLNSKSLSKLTVKDATTKEVRLTALGKDFAKDYWLLFPFIDRSQWDHHGRPYHRHEESDEQYLNFVCLFQELLQKSGEASTLSLLYHLQKPLQDKILKRFRVLAKKKMEDGTEPTTIRDVLNILFSLEAVTKVKRGEWCEVFTDIFNVIGALTYEEGIA